MTEDPMTPDEVREAEAEDARVMRFWIVVAALLLALLVWGLSAGAAEVLA